MKAKVLIFTIIFSLNFANYCEAQIIEGVVSGLLKKSKKLPKMSIRNGLIMIKLKDVLRLDIDAPVIISR